MMNFTCWECGKETDPYKYCTSSCSECKGQFCCALSSDCFSKFHMKAKECNGTCLTITNPQWIVNLKKTLDDENELA